MPGKILKLKMPVDEFYSMLDTDINTCIYHASALIFP